MALLARWGFIPNFLALNQVKWFERRFYHRSHASFLRQDRLKKLVNAEVFTIFILGADGNSVPRRMFQPMYRKFSNLALWQLLRSPTQSPTYSTHFGRTIICRQPIVKATCSPHWDDILNCCRVSCHWGGLASRRFHIFSSGFESRVEPALPVRVYLAL